MNEKMKLQSRIDKLKAEGMVDVKFVFDWNIRENFPRGITVEDICRDINKMFDAIENGHTRKLTAADFGEL
jgi:hypothetical protein